MGWLREQMRSLWGGRSEALPTLEVHIPISPTPLFFNQVQLFTLSLRRFGGPYANAPVIVTVGDTVHDTALTDKQPWAGPLGVEFRWVSVDLFKQYRYAAQGMRRLQYAHTADVVLLVDADVLVAGPFTDAVVLAARHQALCGCIAHLSPFPTFQTPLSWDLLFQRFGLGRPKLRHQYSGWPNMLSGPRSERWCPAYFNYGVVFAPRALAATVGRRTFEIIDRLNAFEANLFNGQVSLALLIALEKIPYRCLSFRYNAANWPTLEQRYPREAKDPRLIHFIDGKGKVFESWEAVERFLARKDLTGLWRRAQQVIDEIYPLTRSP